MSDIEKRNKDITDIAKEVRIRLKEEFPFCGFTVSTQRYAGGRSLTVTLKYAPFEVFKDESYGGYSQVTSNPTVNTPECIKLFERVKEVSNENNFDNSVVQSDYFDVNYHLSLQIATHTQPFYIKTL